MESYRDRFTAEVNMAVVHLKTAQLAYENGRGAAAVEEHFRRARKCLRAAKEVACTTQ